MPTHFAFGYAEERIPAIKSAPTTAEAKTASGSSSQTTAVAPAGGIPVCRVATDVAVYVAFGPNPTAASTSGFLLPAGAVDYFPVSSNDKAAVILA